MTHALTVLPFIYRGGLFSDRSEPLSTGGPVLPGRGHVRRDKDSQLLEARGGKIPAQPL